MHGNSPLFQRLSPQSRSFLFSKKTKLSRACEEGQTGTGQLGDLPERVLAGAAVSRVHLADIHGVSDHFSTCFFFLQACRDGKPELFLLQ